MKISFVACFLGSTAVRASADAGLRASSPAKSKPVKPAADLKAYWSERAVSRSFASRRRQFVPLGPHLVRSTLFVRLDRPAQAEATFMQVAISEEFTHGQCITGCDNPDYNGNRARCRRDCDTMEENGSTTNTRTANCFSCDNGFNYGSRKYGRCMDACETKRDTLDGICDDATNTDECYAWCVGASAAMDFCLVSFPEAVARLWNVGGRFGHARPVTCSSGFNVSRAARSCLSPPPVRESSTATAETSTPATTTATTGASRPGPASIARSFAPGAASTIARISTAATRSSRRCNEAMGFRPFRDGWRDSRSPASCSHWGVVSICGRSLGRAERALEKVVGKRVDIFTIHLRN
ncbi:hypothetical protein ACHAWF_007406 [Thalassiosira exigua]